MVSATEKTEIRAAELQAEIDALQKELGEDESADKILAQHMKLLHKFNEAKDAAQILIGRYSSLTDTTVTQIHKDLGLPIAD